MTGASLSGIGMLSMAQSSSQSRQPKPLQPLQVKKPVNVKIIQARVFYDISNKVEFEVKNQTFVEVNEETANINFIVAAVQRKWGEDYVMV